MLRLTIIFACATYALAATDCHGDVNSLAVTGMRSGGVSASHSAAAANAAAAAAFKPWAEAVGNKYCIQPALIGALASRESNYGVSLTSGGYGDGGHAWGILQCDLTHSGLPCKNCPARSECHVDMMIGRLFVPYFNQVTAKHPSWPLVNRLQGAVVAYNSGVGNVQSINGMDIGTTGNDYSNDVFARAQYLSAHGW